MTSHRWIRPLGSLVIAGGLAASGLLGWASNASAANPSTNSGCPAGYAAKTLAQWAALGYPNVPRYVDNPANGGNNDGVVCGNDIGKTGLNGFPLYQFMDNDVPG